MARAYVDAQIKDNKVVVFSKTYCPFCKMAKSTLSEAGMKDYVVIELDDREDGNEIQDIMQELTGARTVPRVFIGGKCYGGGTEVRDLHSSNKLVPILKEVGAL